jgi:tetratricopeptide (TPR) repeat protein
MRLDQYEQAQDVYQKAVELNPNDLEALFCLGQIAFLSKEFDKARIFLQKVETLAPDNKFAVRARELLAKLDKR